MARLVDIITNVKYTGCRVGCGGQCLYGWFGARLECWNCKDVARYIWPGCHQSIECSQCGAKMIPDGCEPIDMNAEDD